MARTTEQRAATLEDAEEIADIVRSLTGEAVALPGDFTDPAKVREWLELLGSNGIVMVAVGEVSPVRVLRW